LKYGIRHAIIGGLAGFTPTDELLQFSVLGIQL
jgi:hypothetical protein